MSYFQWVRPQCEVEGFYTTGSHKEIDAYSVGGFCEHCNTVFEIMVCYYHYSPCQETRPFPTEEEIQRGIRKRGLGKLRRQYIQVKGYSVIQMYDD